MMPIEDHPSTTATAASPRILAIDPGNTDSAYALIDHTTRQPIEFGKVPNTELRRCLHALLPAHPVAIEMIASYGMPVGAEVFETCVWIGRFAETLRILGSDPDLVKRHPVKVHHCHDSKAKDSNISRALVDRFAPGATNHGKGTKADPGWFYGFRADVWQAYALAVYVADTTTPTVAAPVSAPPCGAGAVPTHQAEGALF